MSQDSVGRVAVEIVPDATDFSKQAKAELEKQKVDPKNVGLIPVIDANMAELQAQMAAIAKRLDSTAQVKVNVDSSQFAAIDAALQQLAPAQDLNIKAKFDPSSEAGIRKALAEIEGAFAKKYVLDVTADNADAVVADLRAQLDAIEKQKVRLAAEIVLNEKAAEAKAALLSERLKKLLVVNFAPSMNTAGVVVEATKTSLFLEKIFGGIVAKIVPVVDRVGEVLAKEKLDALTFFRGVPLVPEVSKAARALASASLDLLTRPRVVTILTKTGGGAGEVASVLSGFDAVQTSVVNAHHAITELFKDLPSLAATTTGVFGLAGAFLSAAQNAAGLVGSAAQALPVLLALPGVAIGITVLSIAFGDLKHTMPDVFAMLTAFKASIQTDFWSAPVAGIGTVKTAFAGFLGGIVGGFGGLAGTMGTFMGTLFADIQSLPLGTWFDNLSNSITKLQQYMGPITATLGTIGSVGSAMLVPLAQLVGQLTAQFGTWLQSMVTNAGGVQAFAIQSVGALNGIIQTVVQLGAIFGVVFKSAQDSGALTFTSLSNDMQNWADGGGLDRLQAKLTTLFTAAHGMFTNFSATAGDSFSSALDNVTKLLSAVLPIVGTIMGTLTKLFASAITPEATAGITAFVDGVAKGITAMQPAFASLGPLIGQLGPVLGTLATTIGTVFGALTPTIENLVPAITPIVQILGQGLVTVIQKLSPMITQLGVILTTALTSPAFSAALDAIVAAVTALIPALTPVIGLIGQLIPALMPLITAVLTPIAGLIAGLVPVLNPIVAVIMGIFNAVAPLIPILINLIMAVLTPILPLITTLATAILPLLVPVIQIVSTVLQILIGLLTPLLQAILPPLIGIITILADVFGVVATAIAGFIQGALQWLQDGITKVSDGISAFFGKWQQIWTDVLSFFQGIWNDLLNWIKDLLGIHSPSTWFLDLATHMFQGMLNGLKAGWDWIVGFFTDAWNWLKNSFTAAFEFYKALVLAAWNTITGFFSNAWNNITGLVSGGWAKVKGFFSDAVANIKSTVSSAWDTVTGFFSTGIGNAVALVKGLPGKLLSALGDLGSILYQKGVDLVQGLLDGVGSLASKIGSWFLDKLPDWIVAPFKAAMGIHSPSKVFHGFGENIITGLLNGMEDNHHRVFRSMDSLAAGMADTKFAMPTVNAGGLGAVAQQVAAAMGGTASRVLNYYAAPGSGLSSEDELFAAAGRGRMVW
jgi:phage-related protein